MDRAKRYWLFGLLVLLTAGALTGTGILFVRAETVRRERLKEADRLAFRLEGAEALMTAAEVERYAEKIKRVVGRDYKRMSTEARITLCKIRSEHLCWEGEFGRSAEVRMGLLGIDASLVSDSYLAFTAYLAAIGGRAVIVKEVRDVRRSDGWSELFFALEAWMQGDWGEVVRRCGSRHGGPVPPGKGYVPGSWLVFLKAKALSRLGERVVANECMSGLLSPSGMKAFEMSAKIHIFIFVAENAEVAGDIKRARWAAKMVESYLSSHILRSWKGEKDRVLVLVQRLEGAGNSD